MQSWIVAFLPDGQLEKVLDYGASHPPYRHLRARDCYVPAGITQNLAGDVDHLIVPGEKLLNQDQAFDLVPLLDELEHIAEPDLVLGDIRRLLAPNGRLIASVPFMYREHEAPHHFALYTVLGMHELLRRKQGGRIRKAGNIYYTLQALFLQGGVDNGEQNRLGLFGRLQNRALRSLVPILAPLLRRPPRDDDGVYHYLLVGVCCS